MKNILAYAWKIPVCGIGFFFSMAIGGSVLPGQGLWVREIPAGTDANLIALWFILGSMTLALALSFVSCNLQVNWLVRWGILAELTWVCGAVAVAVEAFFASTSGMVSNLINALITMLIFLLPSLLLSALVAVLFRPAQPSERRLRMFFSSRKAADWL